MLQLVSEGSMSEICKGCKTGGVSTLRLVSLLAAFLLGGCASVKVATDYDHAASFARYRTYLLAPAPHGAGLSAMAEAALRAALRVNLSARGIEELPNGKPDLDVVRHVFSQKRLSPQQYAKWGYGPGASWPYVEGRYTIWSGAPADFADPNGYGNGALVLDFVDSRTRKLVFRGVARGVIGSRESTPADIENAVAKMIAGLPGGAAR
jgi:Domain of unknown function (DUF4136)